VFAAVAPFYFTESHYYSPQFYSSQLKKFSSYEELKNFVKASSQAYLYYPERFPSRVMAMTGTRRSPSEAYSVSDYSTTNIQVEGVDEADIVKTDGEYIYVVSIKSVSS